MNMSHNMIARGLPPVPFVDEERDLYEGEMSPVAFQGVGVDAVLSEQEELALGQQQFHRPRARKKEIIRVSPDTVLTQDFFLLENYRTRPSYPPSSSNRYIARRPRTLNQDQDLDYARQRYSEYQGRPHPPRHPSGASFDQEPSYYHDGPRDQPYYGNVLADGHYYNDQYSYQDELTVHHQNHAPLPPPLPRRPSDSNNINANRIVMVEITPGFSLPLRGAAETRLYIARGWYVPLRCVACTLDLFGIPDALFILCPVCRSINPLEEGNDAMIVAAATTTATTLKEPQGLGLGITPEELETVQREVAEAWQDSGLGRQPMHERRRVRTYRY